MIPKISKLLDEIFKQLQEFVGDGVAVVGMSGGADSTLTAILCANALGPDKVVSVHMPYGRVDREKYNANSMRVADKLKIASILQPITDVVDCFLDGLEFAAEGVLVEGNVRARMRTVTLYTVANAMGNSYVIGTGNLSEDYIGYDTKGGDALADIFPIGELLKSEVYKLLDFFRDCGIIEEENIDRVPSAGLWPGQTDEKELGYSYAEMEGAVRRFFYLRPDNIRPWAVEPTKVERFVLDRHFANRHKHEAPTVITGLRGMLDGK